MARVPTRDNFRVLPGGGGSGRVRANASGLASVQGRDLQQVGQTVQQAGGVLNNYVEREQDKLNQARVREAALTFREDMAEAEREYQQYQGAELVAGDKPIMRDIEARIEQRRSELFQGLTSQDAQEAFEIASMEMASGFRQRAAAYEAQQADFYVDQQRDGMIQAQIETAISSPEKRATSLQEANAVLREKFEDQGFDGDRLNQKTQEAMGQLLAGQLDALIDAGDTQAARDVLEAGGDYLASDDASKLRVAIKNKEAETRTLAIYEGRLTAETLSEMHQAGQIDDGDYMRHKAQLDQYERQQEAQRKAEETERYKNNFERLRVAVDDGLMTRADVDLAFERDQINISQWSQAARLANDVEGRQSSSSNFAESMQLGLPIDPRDNETRKGANALFRAKGGRALFAEDFNLGLAQTAQFAQAGIIPDDAQTVLSGFVSSGTPEQQRLGLTAIGDLYELAPNAVDAAFSDNQLSDAISYTHKVNAGVDENAAYEALLVEREARANPSSGYNALIAEARAISKDFDISDALKRRDADGKGGFLSSGPKVGSDAKPKHVDDPIVEAQILSDFTDQFEAYYSLHGDEELAKRQAAVIMGKTVGRSEANGGRAMMHPPEKVYGLDGDWAANALQEMFAERDGGVSDIQLISDVRTNREMREGRAPTYGVVVFDENGVMVPLQARVDFSDEYRAEIEKRQEEARKAQIEAAKGNNKAAERILEREALERKKGDDMSRQPFQRDLFQIGGRLQSEEEATRTSENVARDRERLEGY
jgi:predicted DNA-binding antitoxin AbrB/MazE fold protein